MTGDIDIYRIGYKAATENVDKTHFGKKIILIYSEKYIFKFNF